MRRNGRKMIAARCNMMKNARSGKNKKMQNEKKNNAKRMNSKGLECKKLKMQKKSRNSANNSDNAKKKPKRVSSLLQVRTLLKILLQRYQQIYNKLLRCGRPHQDKSHPKKHRQRK